MDTSRQDIELGLRRLLTGRLQDQIRTSNHKLLLWARSQLGQPYVSYGKISVVVPIYNVERYLHECLESIRVQSYPDLEVLMIDDGSPDNSVDIARNFVNFDRRFRLIRQENSGLGAARNTGVREATGSFLTFVDSDDAIPQNAYRDLVISLFQSESDFAVGGVERWMGHSRWRDDWVSRVHGVDLKRITLDDLPEITLDVFAWNKLFRTQFFRNKVVSFPEKILYEDQEPTAKAYVGCDTFDVISSTTYFWRIRDDGSSITQNKLTLRDLRDRIAVAETVMEIYQSGASEKVFSAWKQKTAGLDFGHYYRLSHRGSEEYWQLLVTLTQFLGHALTADEWGAVPAKERTLAYLISIGDRAAVATTIGAQSQYPSGVPATMAGGEFFIDLAQWGLSDMQFPRHIARLTSHDTPLRTGISKLNWSEDGTLRIEGFAFIDKFPRLAADTNLQMWARAEDNKNIPLDVEGFSFAKDDPTLPRTSFSEHPESGFRVDVAPQTLDSYSNDLEVFVSLTSGGVHRSSVLLPQSAEHIPRLRPFTLNTGEILTVSGNRQRGLALRRNIKPALLKNFRIDPDRNVHFEFIPIERAGRFRIRAVNRASGNHAHLDSPPLSIGDSWQVSLRLPPRSDKTDGRLETIWEFTLVHDDKVWPLPYPQGTRSEITQAERGALGLRWGDFADLQISDFPWALTLESITGTSDGLEVSGYYDSTRSEIPELALVRLDGATLRSDSLEIDATTGMFLARIPMTSEPEWGKPFVSRTTGMFGVCILPQGETDPFAASHLVYFNDRAVNGVKSRTRTPGGFAEITDLGSARSAFVKLQGPNRPSDWNNGSRSERIHTLRDEALNQPIKPRVALCLSFSGKSVHDSPRPIAEAMLRHGLVDEVIWGVADDSMSPGPGSHVIPVDSTEFIDLLHTAKFLINNAHFPHYFRKRPDQIYVQTWHGTPLKRIANDVPSTALSDSYRDLMEREVRSWDLLIAQGTIPGKILQAAFGFDGDILTSGYPRNDVVLDSARMLILRARFRQRFSIGPEERVVLYAPTWRDNSQSVTVSGYESLDAGQLLDQLGPGSRLLLRGHSNTLGFGREVSDERVLDVSGFSDLAELFAASDLLVTDYSSVFFDYALTGKPILGFAPDLTSYSDTRRGLYFAYSDVFPGPIAFTNSELIEFAKNLEYFVYKQSPILADILMNEKGEASLNVIAWLKGRSSRMP